MSETRRIKIADVIVGDRFRRELGDIEALAKSLREVGLLQPVGVTEDNKLVFGNRRLEAAKLLGWTEIDAHVINVEDLLRAECDENEVRKNFTASERVAIYKAIRESMGERRGQPQKSIVEISPQYFAGTEDVQSGVGETNCPETSPQVEQGEKTREYAAKKSGLGSTWTVRQAERVVDNGVPELVRAMDTEQLTINTAGEIARLSAEEQPTAIAEKISKPKGKKKAKQVSATAETAGQDSSETQTKKAERFGMEQVRELAGDAVPFRVRGVRDRQQGQAAALRDLSVWLVRYADVFCDEKDNERVRRTILKLLRELKED